MSTIANVQQDQMWNGRDGRDWADNHDRWEGVASGCNEHLLGAARLQPDAHVLDIGCGNGRITRSAARLVYDGFATGVDLSGPMLENARRLAEEEGVANVGFERGDAQVHPFPDAGFDAAISRFGVMFFTDPVAAFTNIARALKPGGRLALAVPPASGRADSSTAVIFSALDEHVPPPTAPDVPAVNLTSLSDPDYVTELLTTAGFDKPTVTPVEYPMTLGRDAVDAANFVTQWPLFRYRLSDADRTTVDRVRSGTADALRPYEGPGGVQLPASALIVHALRP